MICGKFTTVFLFVPNLPRTSLLLTIDKQLCDDCYRVIMRVRVPELAQKFKDQPEIFLWLIACGPILDVF